MSRPAFDMHHSKNWADKRDLYRIEKIDGGLRGLQGLPKDAQSWVWFFVEVLSMGFDEVRAPIGALTDARHRACPGSNKSKSSTHRAFRALKDNGFISTRKFRIGANHYLSIISLNRARFEFFTRGRELTHMGKCARTYYSSSCESDWGYDDVTGITPRSETSCSYQQRGASCMPEKKKNAGKPSRQNHPVYYSLKCVLFRLGHPRRNQILKLALDEIAGAAKSSLTDWGYWLPRWKDVSVATRENLVEKDILPNYADRFTMERPARRGEPFFFGSPRESGPTSDGGPAVQSDLDLEQIVARIAKRIEGAPTTSGGLENEKKLRKAETENYLEPGELAQLQEIRDTSKARKL